MENSSEPAQASQGQPQAQTPQKKEYLPVLLILLVHYLISAGIVAIGQRMKNKKEFYGGILLILIILGLGIYSYTEPCVRLCLSYREKPYILYQETEELICNNCPAMALYTLSGLLSLLSWVYVFVRLYLIHKNNIMELRLI